MRTRNWLLLLAALLLALFGVSRLLAATVTFTWDYTYKAPPCSATVTANCIEGFELRNANGSVITTFPNPPTAALNATVTDISGEVIVGPPFGLTRFDLFTKGRDNAGAAIYSATPASISLVVTPDRPANLRGVVRD